MYEFIDKIPKWFRYILGFLIIDFFVFGISMMNGDTTVLYNLLGTLFLDIMIIGLFFAGTLFLSTID
jgi:ABC-type polysaccharide/polyol phosphate export permease